MGAALVGVLLVGLLLTQPNRFIVVLYVGAACLAAGVVSLGIGLLTG